MSKLDAFEQAKREDRNAMLFGWLSDDNDRLALYADLRAAAFPILRCPSLAGDGKEDVYLLSSKADVVAALKDGSVKPYAELGSGGRFMLGIDEERPHDAQRDLADEALHFDSAVLREAVELAVKRALVWPRLNTPFDLVTDFAEQAALRFIVLLFGLPVRAHAALEGLMRAAYRRLSFQIVGRHFVPDQPPPPEVGARLLRLHKDLNGQMRQAMGLYPQHPVERDDGWQHKTVLDQLGKMPSADDAAMIALGLMAGTVGNMRAAIAIAMQAFFNPPDDQSPTLEHAIDAARNDVKGLETMIMAALVRQPPAPFLTRLATDKLNLTFSENGKDHPVPQGAYLLLALGADADEKLVFGDAAGGLMHRCVGERLARPLIVEAVRELLLLPGLSQVIDPVGGKPKPLVKRWGAICESYPVQHRRAQKLVQQPLYVVLPIKPPVEENARILMRLTRDGAHVVEEALRKSRHVHFAWFNLAENGTHLAMTTVFDGDFDAYIRHFALTVPLFDTQFKYLDCDQPTPITKYPNEFVATIKRYNRAPLGGYFFSAYPTTTVADVLREDGP